MPGLFRDEVLEARRTAVFGRVVLRSPLSLSLACVGAAAVAIALVVLLCFGQYTRRARIHGITVPSAGVVKLTAPQPGTVLERRAHEGQRVAAGDVLFVVGSERFAGSSRGTPAHAAALEQMQRRRAILEEDRRRHARQSERQADALRRRQAALEREARHLREETATHAAREASADEQARRYEALARQGFVSPVAARQHADERLEQRARRQAVQRSLIAVEREIETVAAERRQLPLLAAQRVADIDKEITQLEQDVIGTEAARRVVITAPRDGYVTAIAAEPGQHVGGAPQPLATLLPADSPMEAHLFAPSRAIGFVEPGQSVRVRFAAYPFQKFGQYDGVVVQVSRAAMGPAELPAQLPSPAAAEALYRVKVRLAAPYVVAYGEPQPLVAGMQVEADVMQDRRRLIEWVFEPLIALGRRA